tara:strand:- start:697 stop:1227 length:531 start_codon:yes stop_codon:yes gene_type:complete
MADTRFIVDHLKIDYDGILDLKGLFRVMSQWALDRDCEQNELTNREDETETGKHLEYLQNYSKRFTDYTIFYFKIRISGSHLQTVTVTEGKKKVKRLKGKIRIFLDGQLMHDSENKWDDHPVLLFIRKMYEKYFYHAYTERFDRLCATYTHDLYNHLTKFLNIPSTERIESTTPSQ